jgi:predicted ATPase
MSDQVLRSIEVEGFTSIERATVGLGRINVLVGANGAGKSNFIRALELLGRIVDGDLGYFVGLNGGASALLNHHGQAIKLRLDGGTDVYEATLVASANDELIFKSEILSLPHRVNLGPGGRESALHVVENAFGGQSPASGIVALLKGCRVFHFHDTSLNAPVKQFISTGDNLALRANAGNLAAVLLAMQNSQDFATQAAYRRLVGVVRQVAPFFRDFELKPENDRIRLRWRQVGVDKVFTANQMSDGTLRFVCLATLLLQPDLPALVVLDEPELGLHPYAIVQLAGLLQQASTRSQVLFATQSVTLMNQFQLADLIVVDRVDGASVFTRPDPARLSSWLDEYSLGELWEKNLLGGRPGAGI